VQEPSKLQVTQPTMEHCWQLLFDSTIPAGHPVHVVLVQVVHGEGHNWQWPFCRV
jgi:hypothetical protein